MKLPKLPKCPKIEKINWRKFITRKILFIAAIVFVLHTVDSLWHIRVAGRGGEMMLGSLIEHICFGVPVLDE